MKAFGKEFAKQFANSFFFCCLIFLILYVLFADKLNTYVSLVNLITIKDNGLEKEAIKFDLSKNKLANYPYYGEKWATLKIAEIDMELPIYQGDTLNILKKGVGHFSGTYFPGEGGSILLDAHNNKGVFRRLPELKEGSEIVIETNYGTFTYKLTSTAIINKAETDKFPIQHEEELLMLYTCYPVTAVGMTPYRYVVYAELVGEEYVS